MFGGDRGEILLLNFFDCYVLNDEMFMYIIINLDLYGKIWIMFDDWDLVFVSIFQV